MDTQTRTITWAVCLRGELVTRERASEWHEGALREAVLSWPDLPDEGAEYRGGPLRATEFAARLKAADPGEVVQVLLWTDDDAG